MVVGILVFAAFGASTSPSTHRHKAAPTVKATAMASAKVSFQRDHGPAAISFSRHHHVSVQVP
jgi:hypothetical protein